MTTIDTYSHNVSGEKEFGFAQAIKAGDTIYISGQLSHDDQGEFLFADDLGSQFHQVWANLNKVLAHFGASRNQIVQDGVFVVNLPDNAAAVAAAHLAYFGDHRPTSTTVGVNALFFPGQLLEINFIVDTRLPA
ncbi:RidA family protein [Cryobacterium sp. N22]|uniref:RidA family protein n=1 Tax=Cryobacterium sp. N22 TaxID=2048290 RepID=UPI000CE326D4|nr:RidA family protein [Cryobacterium sp. N22]